jgi:hypothetical protein
MGIPSSMTFLSGTFLFLNISKRAELTFCLETMASTRLLEIWLGFPMWILGSYKSIGIVSVAFAVAVAAILSRRLKS